ncbi:hypothetical protein, partial [Moraxella porci]|uniref:hypothetical protein n=1 Tax=Moraxella porci TaxID=1288392 RepID=UPI002446904F
GGLDVNTTIDTRVFTTAGRQEIKKEQMGLGQNLDKIKDDIVSDIELGYDIASDAYKSILILKKIEEVRSQLNPEEQEYFDQYLLEFQQNQDLLRLNAAPAAGVAAIGATELTALAAGAGVAVCSATEACSDAVEDGFKSTQKAAKEATNAIIDYTVGIFSSDSPKTGNDELDEVLEDATRSDDGDKGYEYPGTREELIEELQQIEGARHNPPRPDGGTTTILPDGTKIDTYPSRSSTGKPGWSVTKPGKAKPSIKGDTQR